MEIIRLGFGTILLTIRRVGHINIVPVGKIDVHSDLVTHRSPKIVQRRLLQLNLILAQNVRLEKRRQPDLLLLSRIDDHQNVGSVFFIILNNSRWEYSSRRETIKTICFQFEKTIVKVRKVQHSVVAIDDDVISLAVDEGLRMIRLVRYVLLKLVAFFLRL